MEDPFSNRISLVLQNLPLMLVEVSPKNIFKLLGPMLPNSRSKIILPS